ncbi:hypothetical protein GCM10020220_018420 [Nonomuraea rubra]
MIAVAGGGFTRAKGARASRRRAVRGAVVLAVRVYMVPAQTVMGRAVRACSTVLTMGRSE